MEVTVDKGMKFKTWLEAEFGSDGDRNNAPTQTTTATSKIGDQWLAQPQNVPAQSQMVQLGTSNKSALAPKILNAAAQAMQKAPNNMKNQTNSPQIASYFQSTLNLPTVIKAPKPTQAQPMMMRKQ